MSYVALALALCVAAAVLVESRTLRVLEGRMPTGGGGRAHTRIVPIVPPTHIPRFAGGTRADAGIEHARGSGMWSRVVRPIGNDCSGGVCALCGVSRHC